MFQVIRSFLALAVPIVLIGMHFAVMLCFINRWDSVVTITLIPIWLWAIVGIVLAILTWIAFKSRLALLVAFIWTATALVCADETLPLLRSAKHLVFPPADTSAAASAPDSPAGQTDTSRSIRVVTLNCNKKGDAEKAARELVAAFRPAAADDARAAETAAVDVVFLQEAPGDDVLREISRELFGANGAWLSHQGSAILARGRLEPIDLKMDGPIAVRGTQMAAMLELEPGVEVELVNVHLKRSILRYDVWRSEAWRTNTEVRISNRASLRSILANLPDHAVNRPRVIGGDFGTPYNDDIYRVLQRDHSDAFRAVGSGWSNTYPNDYPLLRIDQVWATNDLTPLDAETLKTAGTDHRLVSVRFRLNAPAGFLAMR